MGWGTSDMDLLSLSVAAKSQGPGFRLDRCVWKYLCFAVFLWFLLNDIPDVQ
jgi:hypothetical protein